VSPPPAQSQSQREQQQQQERQREREREREELLDDAIEEEDSLPPPMPTIRSGWNSRATAVPASTCAVVGFSPNSSKTVVAIPHEASAASPAAVWPARMTP